MMIGMDRRHMILGIGACAGAVALAGPAPAFGRGDPVAPFRTPYKYPRLVLAASGTKGRFDERSVDCPFVFSANGRFYMSYVGWDGTGYQTGLAESRDLLNWTRTALILPRDPASPVTRFNIASASILRENGLTSPGRLIKVDGRYVCAWHAYPSAGYEEGPAVIGLAWSDDLIHWRREDPCLYPADGAAWERGGLYKPYLVKHGDTYLMYYNAKTTGTPWHEQTGVAISRDLKNWTRHPGNPILKNGPAGSWDDRFASDPVVVEHDGRWAMFYFGLSSDRKARDLLAIGPTPLEFDKVPEILVDTGRPGSVDDTYAHKPTVIYHDGALYHFYCAVAGKYPNETRGIALARSRPWRS
ncbi:family 43 glycosylhydrolase [Sphingomonas montana]|uniref:family 43 glycosylhydrolase n=1 Tax=Sphingomonas montana TaxID=1843236 RepID=UPI0009F93B13|nr:family 43 glycosylhydrolase [Sphingomonas montana]